MTPQEERDLSDENYGLLFDIRRSIRYHTRRAAFFTSWHLVTNILTVLMAGSFLFDLGKSGDPVWWLKALSAVAALLAAADIALQYSTRASIHNRLSGRFSDLEIKILRGPADGTEWQQYREDRLIIERDEPAIFKVLDLLCRNELLSASGRTRENSPAEFFYPTLLQRVTCQVLRWEDIDPYDNRPPKI